MTNIYFIGFWELRTSYILGNIIIYEKRVLCQIDYFIYIVNNLPNSTEEIEYGLYYV